MTDREWNHLSIRMCGFHNKFRHDFKQIYALADCYQKRGLSFSRFIEYAQSFETGLGFHHHIEETIFFLILAERMPEFRDHSEHKDSHVQIHAGLDNYAAYLASVKSAPTKYEAQELRRLMKAFEDVLFKHLADEETSLKRPNMEKYWTLEEVKRISI